MDKNTIWGLCYVVLGFVCLVFGAHYAYTAQSEMYNTAVSNGHLLAEGVIAAVLLLSGFGFFYGVFKK